MTNVPKEKHETEGSEGQGIIETNGLLRAKMERGREDHFCQREQHVGRSKARVGSALLRN